MKKKAGRRPFARVWAIMTAAVMLAASLTACGAAAEKDAGSEAETALAEGQRKAVIQVVSITGNELTYIELETEEETETGESAESEAEDIAENESGTAAEGESEVAAESESETAAGSESEAQTGASANDDLADTNEPEDEDADASETRSTRGRGEMPDMSQTADGEMPDFSQTADGEMPDFSQMADGEMPDFSQMADGEMPGMSEMADGEMTDFSQLGAEQDTVTVYLPVGVKVLTDTGKEAAFTILEAGDELEVLFETDEDGEEIITEIQMLS